MALLALVLPGILAGFVFVVALVVCLTDAWLVRRVPTVTVTAPPIVSRGVPTGLTVDVEPSVGLTVRQVGTPDVRIEPDTGDG
jgi:uncharacterized protein (DUF58 family)